MVSRDDVSQARIRLLFTKDTSSSPQLTTCLSLLFKWCLKCERFYLENRVKLNIDKTVYFLAAPKNKLDLLPDIPLTVGRSAISPVSKCRKPRSPIRLWANNGAPSQKFGKSSLLPPQAHCPHSSFPRPVSSKGPCSRFRNVAPRLLQLLVRRPTREKHHMPTEGAKCRRPAHSAQRQAREIQPTPQKTKMGTCQASYNFQSHHFCFPLSSLSSTRIRVSLFSLFCLQPNPIYKVHQHHLPLDPSRTFGIIRWGSISFLGLSFLNFLPPTIANSTSLGSFKAKLKTRLLCNAFSQ